MRWRVDPASKPGGERTEKSNLLTIAMYLNATWYQLLKTGSAQSSGPFWDVLVGPGPPSEVLGSGSLWSYSCASRCFPVSPLDNFK